MDMQPSGRSDSTIILPLRKQEHADFLRDLFNGQRGQPIKLSRHEFAGRFIFSLLKYADRPVQQRIPEGMIPVEIEFPDTSNSTHENRYSFFPVEHVEQINDFIAGCFDLYFHTYFFDTRDIEEMELESDQESPRVTRQMLVDSFVVGLDMLDFARATETVKKREYRKSVKEMVRTQKKFLQKDYNFRKKIYLKRRKNLQGILFQGSNK